MIPAISPTQISTWRLCKRKFGFTYLTDLPKPTPSKAQLIGIGLHKKVENYFKTGLPDYTDTDSKLLGVVLDYLPTGALSEQKVTVVIDGVTFSGKYDWFVDSELGDLKTTSNLQYAKSEAELAVDPQALIYAMGQGMVAPELVTCRWVYVQTKGHPHVIERRFKPDFGALPELVEDGKAITQAWIDKPKPEDLEPNTSACDAFGGCPFRSKCYIDPGERLIALQKRMGLHKEERTMGTQKTFEEMMAEVTGIQEVNPPLPAPAVPTQVPESVVSQPLGTATMVAEPPKAKRTRKPKDTDPAPAPSDKPIGMLLISCLPVGHVDNNLEWADYIINAARAEINEKANVEDYRLVPFGAGAGMLVAVVEEKVKTLRPKMLYLDSRTPEGRLLTGPLMVLAEQTYQGV